MSPEPPETLTADTLRQFKALNLPQRLRDNDQESQESSAALQSLISQATQTMSKCDDAIAQLKEQISVLQSEVVFIEDDKLDLKLQMDQAHSLLHSPIRKLPVECLLEVFRYIGEMAAIDGGVPQVPAVRLLAVCEHWNKIVSGAVSLWSHIRCIYWLSHEPDTPELVATLRVFRRLLKQSGIAPLHVSLTGYCPSGLLDTILVHSARLRYLSLKVAILPSLSPVEVTFDQLQGLELMGSIITDFQRLDVLVPFAVPTLRSLTVYILNADETANSPGFSINPVLPAKMASLTTLSIQSAHIDPFLDLLDAFGATLVEVTFTLPKFGDHGHIQRRPRAPLTLTRLQCLNLSMGELWREWRALMLLCESFATPALTQFHLHCDRTDHPDPCHFQTCSLEPLQTFLSASRALTTLEIHCIWPTITTAELIGVLTCCPLLHDLRLTENIPPPDIDSTAKPDCECLDDANQWQEVPSERFQWTIFSQGFFDSMNLRTLHPLVPQLARLQLDLRPKGFNWDAFLKTIRSRVRGTPTSITRLKYVRLGTDVTAPEGFMEGVRHLSVTGLRVDISASCA